MRVPCPPATIIAYMGWVDINFHLICSTKKQPFIYMARFLFIFSLLIGSTLASAQKMYSCNQAYEADLKVFVVNQKYEADLCVYRAAQKYEAVDNKGLWFFTEHKYEADKKIFFANQKYEAKLLIYFVKNKYEAGWQKKEKQYLLY
jgi:hypothetical protein